MMTYIETCNYLMKKVGRVILKEIQTMCSARVQSILCSQSKNALKNFKWVNLMTELCTYSPLLNKSFHFCTKISKTMRNMDATIGTCAGISFKISLIPNEPDSKDNFINSPCGSLW